MYVCAAHFMCSVPAAQNRICTNMAFLYLYIVSGGEHTTWQRVPPFFFRTHLLATGCCTTVGIHMTLSDGRSQHISVRHCAHSQMAMTLEHDAVLLHTCSFADYILFFSSNMLHVCVYTNF